MNIKLWAVIVVGLLGVTGCARIQGTTIPERQRYVLDMRDESLVRLYEAYPDAKKQIKKAAGYAAFSNGGSNLFLLSTGSGFGVVTDNKTKKVTYMKMASVGIGIGLGVKTFRAVIIFKNREDMETFVEEGWDAKGQADAALKAGDDGAAGSVAQTADMDVVTYQMTETGAALQATLQGMKYWKDKKLNSTQP